MSRAAADGRITRVLHSPAGSPGGNFAFDVTPARLVTGPITERGICRRRGGGHIADFFPKKPLDFYVLCPFKSTMLTPLEKKVHRRHSGRYRHYRHALSAIWPRISASREALLDTPRPTFARAG